MLEANSLTVQDKVETRINTVYVFKKGLVTSLSKAGARLQKDLDE